MVRLFSSRWDKGTVNTGRNRWLWQLLYWIRLLFQEWTRWRKTGRRNDTSYWLSLLLLFFLPAFSFHEVYCSTVPPTRRGQREKERVQRTWNELTRENSTIIARLIRASTIRSQRMLVCERGHQINFARFTIICRTGP